MRRALNLLHDRRGATIVEFALLAPVFALMLVGVLQMGRLFFADADLNNALTNGARQATIFPMPSDDDILDAVEAQLTGLNPELLVNEITHHQDTNGIHYSQMRVSYAVPLDFLFFNMGPVTLSATRRVYTHDPNASQPATSSSSSTGGTTTSAGGTTTTSGGTTTTSGGTTTTSGGTTTTSGGTTTTSGGTTTTSGGTTTTSGGTTTGGTTSSTGGNNGNGNGNGRGSGTCRRCSS
jgi:Flp pilus assembly protein TadG